MTRRPDRGADAAGAERLRYLVLAAQREGERLLARALAPLGLTPAQAEVVRVLAAHAPLTVRELGGLLVCEQGSPSRLAASVVAKGLAAAEPVAEDRRKLHLRLTREGQEAERALARIEDGLHALIAGRLPGPDMAAAEAALRRLVAGLPSAAAIRRRFGDG